MDPFVRVTALQDEHIMEVDIKKCRFVSDDMVRVTSGPFEGVTGRAARIARQNRVVAYLKGLERCQSDPFCIFFSNDVTFPFFSYYKSEDFYKSIKTENYD